MLCGIIITRNSSCEKVMFSQVSVCPWGGQTAGGTHPTGMHSCFRVNIDDDLIENPGVVEIHFLYPSIEVIGI